MTERLTIIAGPMFAGKSTELLRFVERAEIAGKSVLLVKPDIDTRYNSETVSTHAGGEHAAVVIPINKPELIQEFVDYFNQQKPPVDMVCIDEVQFFDDSIVGTIFSLLDQDIVVIASGLPADFARRPFGPMGRLLAMADERISLTAICTARNGGVICGQSATLTQRLVNGQPPHEDDPVVIVGAAESYAAVCPTHHRVKRGPKN